MLPAAKEKRANMSGALDGLLVVSVEQAVAALYCSARLADAGARVLKIERPEGDVARGYDGTAVRSITRTPTSGPGICLRSLLH